jgi:hypothetical protein
LKTVRVLYRDGTGVDFSGATASVSLYGDGHLHVAWSAQDGSIRKVIIASGVWKLALEGEGLPPPAAEPPP